MPPVPVVPNVGPVNERAGRSATTKNVGGHSQGSDTERTITNISSGGASIAPRGRSRAPISQDKSTPTSASSRAPPTASRRALSIARNRKEADTNTELETPNAVPTRIPAPVLTAPGVVSMSGKVGRPRSATLQAAAEKSSALTKANRGEDRKVLLKNNTKEAIAPSSNSKEVISGGSETIIDNSSKLTPTDKGKEREKSQDSNADLGYPPVFTEGEGGTQRTAPLATNIDPSKPIRGRRTVSIIHSELNEKLIISTLGNSAFHVN